MRSHPAQFNSRHSMAFKLDQVLLWQVTTINSLGGIWGLEKGLNQQNPPPQMGTADSFPN